MIVKVLENFSFLKLLHHNIINFTKLMHLVLVYEQNLNVWIFN